MMIVQLDERVPAYKKFLKAGKKGKCRRVKWIVENLAAYNKFKRSRKCQK